MTDTADLTKPNILREFNKVVSTRSTTTAVISMFLQTNNIDS